MKPSPRTPFTLLFLVGLLLLPAGTLRAGTGAAGIEFGKPFWSQWGDGRAELAAYDVSIPRYGEKRSGVAVTIVIPETFSESLRVKADRGKHPASDEFPVLKLNLMTDFPTGVYDYNLMTSAFTTMAPRGGRSAGAPAKVSFSAQEWCGHTWRQFLFDSDAVRFAGHSYFDGEADEAGKLPYPPEGVSEDALLLWARGWAAPPLAPGESVEVPLLTSARISRFAHEEPAWTKAVLGRSAKPQSITVPAGTFEVDVMAATVEAGRKWTFYVEQGGERRVIRWTQSDGEQGDLVASERLKYWEMNGGSFTKALEKLGLRPRPPRTP